MFPNYKIWEQNGIIPIKNGITVKRSEKQLYRFRFRLPFCISRFRSVFVFYIGFEIDRDKTNKIGYTITVGSGFSHPTFIPSWGRVAWARGVARLVGRSRGLGMAGVTRLEKGQGAGWVRGVLGVEHRAGERERERWRVGEHQGATTARRGG